jgi:hypothetical protein
MKLSETQTAILAAAIARDDRMVFPVTLQLKGGAVGNVLKSLLKRGLVQEMPTADGGVVWRCGQDGQPLTLRASDAGANLLGGGIVHPSNRELTVVQTIAAAALPGEHKRGTITEVLIALLSRPGGATIAEMRDVTGWLPHSIRGALSGVVAKKMGKTVESTKEERGRVYRIAS